LGPKVNCITPSYSSVLLGQNVVTKIELKKIEEGKRERETMNKKKKSVVIIFFFIVQIFLPYYVSWTWCFSQQDCTNVYLPAFIYLLVLDERVLRKRICCMTIGLKLLLCVSVWWRDNTQTCYHTCDSSSNKTTKQCGLLHTYIIPKIIYIM